MQPQDARLEAVESSTEPNYDVLRRRKYALARSRAFRRLAKVKKDRYLEILDLEYQKNGIARKDYPNQERNTDVKDYREYTKRRNAAVSRTQYLLKSENERLFAKILARERKNAGL